MKRFGKMVGLVGLIGMSLSLLGMTSSQIPSKFNIPWGNSAGPAYIRSIPQSSQIGIQNCAASLTDGFPPLTFTPSGAGGCPPFGQDFNGILKQITQWAQWQSAGGPVFWDSAFSTAVGGYPKGATLQSSVLPGRIWFSTAENNTTNPDDQTGAAAGWVALPFTKQPGEVFSTFSTTSPIGSVPSNGQTIGNASSNASSRANVDTFWAFSFLWSNCSGCQLFNSAGGAIGRGATAVADWAANDAIATPLMNGAGMMGADSMTGTTSTNLVNVPVTSGSRTVPTSILGENLHSLTSGENGTHTHANTLNLGSHTHSYTFAALAGGAGSGAATCVGSCLGGTGSGTTGSSGSNDTLTNAASGSGTPHNTVMRVFITYWNLAL